MDSLTVSSSMLIPSASNVEITPAMLAVLWRISHELDRLRMPAFVKDATWLEIPAASLRNPKGRNDNHWLKQSLDKLTGVKLSGEYRDEPWGAVLLAQWEILDGGRVVRLLVPPAAIQAIRAPKTFTKIEITAAYKLKGHARRLYAALADKKRMKETYWEYSIPELRQLFDIGDKYPRFADFNRYVLKPALQEIEDYGTVKATATHKKTGRFVRSVRFDWSWKTLDDARVTDEENERHTSARKKGGDGSAPPLTDLKNLHQIAKNVRAEVNDAQWDNWFSHCEFVEDEQGKITVVTPSKFHTKYMSENFQETLNNAGWAIAEKPQGTVPIVTKAETVNS